MFNTLKSMFASAPKANFAELARNGAQIIDVRSHGEYASGHIKGSVNIPLQTLESEIGKIKKDKPVITCCASGMRSASAASILKNHGFSEVYNGGGWASLEHEIR